MDIKRPPLFDSEPAAYPETSASEASSKHLLMSLFDSQFIRGELRIMDKYPNSDGIMEVTDATGVVKGKIDVQLKTLPNKRTGKPSHACDRPFMVHCQNSTLPVILIVVDLSDKKAYWQHMNYEILSDIKKNIKAKTYSLAIPVENCIDGKSKDYIDRWTKICESVYEKVWNYDVLKAEHVQLAAELDLLQQRFGPLTLNKIEVTQVQQFLDIYNYLLDYDFQIIKRARYSNYWKIGIGIRLYTDENCTFVVFPIPYGNNEPLIRQVIAGSIKDIGREFMLGTILRIQSYSSHNPIRSSPESLAYSMLKSDFEYVIKRVQFEVPDDFMANEYIYAFASRFAILFNLNAEDFELKELQFLVNNILPLLIELKVNFVEGLSEITFNIDSYQKLKPNIAHPQRVDEAVKRFKQGYKPKIVIIPTSEDFHLDILRFYIEYLLQQGITKTSRIYNPNLRKTFNTGYVWESWDYDVVTENLAYLMENLQRVYQLLLERHFPRMLKQLNLFQNINLLGYCLSFEHGQHPGPRLEYYKATSRTTQPNEVLFWTDANRPFERHGTFENGWIIKIGSEVYDLRASGSENLTFMFNPLPMHDFIRSLLQRDIGELLSEKSKAE